MAKKRSGDAYKKLGRVLIVLLVLLVVCVAGVFLMDQSIQAQQTENNQRAAEENALLEAQYQQAKAEESAKQQQGESVQWPQPKAEGWDVVDLTEFPLTNTYTATVSRHELTMGGLMLLNQWHSLPSDFSEDELLAVYTVDKTIPVSGAKVRLFPAAISALGEMLSAAKEEGLEGYVVSEGYRTMEEQSSYYNEAAAKYIEKYSGEALIEKVRTAENVNYPGTSEYQSGFSLRMDRYSKTDKELMDKKFVDTELSDWLVANSWQYGYVFRFPVQGYPNDTVTDKSYKTGVSSKLCIYRYVGKGHAAVMHALDMCMEEYIEYLMQHPHIAVYEDGELKYEITRTAGGTTAADVQAQISMAATDYTVSTDNVGGVVVCMSY